MRVAHVQYSTHFIRSFKKLPAGLKRKIVVCEQHFLVDCFDSILDTHKLAGRLEGFWAFSVTRKHRVLFCFEEDGSVTFIDVGDHGIYR